MSSESSSVMADRLTGLLTRFEVRARVLDADPVLRFPRRYGAGGVAEDAGHLHVLWAGVVELEGSAPGRRRRVEGPALLLVAGGGAHQIVPIDRPMLACAALDFAHGTAHPLVRALPPELVVAVESVAGLEPVLAALVNEVEHVRCGRPVVASRLLEVVLLLLLRWALDHPQEAGVTDGMLRGMADPRLAAVLTALHERPGDAWNLTRMAKAAMMSRSAFADRFRAVVGETPGAYLTGYRVALAQDRLLRGDAVHVIASELGYANGSGFSRAFSARTGVAPSAWLATAARAEAPPRAGL